MLARLDSRLLYAMRTRFHGSAAETVGSWLGRIGEYGASPNKLASLGLNLILLVNLSGSAWLQFRFVRGRTTFGHVERWQTAYIPVYLAWAAIVLVAFPPVFGFA